MKKWIVALSVALIALVICVYAVVPNAVSFQNDTFIETNPQAFSRTIFDNTTWSKWWPGKVQINATGSPSCFFRGNTYIIADKTLSSLIISIKSGDNSAKTVLNFIPSAQDSMHVIWEAQYPTSIKPFKRLQLYLQSREMKKEMNIILERLQSFFSNPDNIYGIHIQQILVSDSLLVSTHATSKGYPTTEFVYGLIGQLKNYVAKQSAKETDSPMLHITTTDSITYLTRVAIPVNKKLNSSGNISYKWMMGGGKILVTEIKGGPGIINNAFLQMETYVRDHNRVAPAIPFQSLVTDRMKEKDTSKWITRIYYPVM